MASINVGDLVCMYRRKKKGMGIVLESTPDIIEKAEIDGGLTFDEFYEVVMSIGGDYRERTQYRDSLKNKAKHPEMIRTCLLYNASWARKTKKEFVKIRWFDAPSLYETAQIKEVEEWCPTDWVRKVSSK